MHRLTERADMRQTASWKAPPQPMSWLPITCRKLLSGSGNPLLERLTQRRTRPRQWAPLVPHLRWTKMTGQNTDNDKTWMLWKPSASRPLLLQNTRNSDIKKGQYAGHLLRVYLTNCCNCYKIHFHPVTPVSPVRSQLYKFSDHSYELHWVPVHNSPYNFIP